MQCTRREFAVLAATALPAATLMHPFAARGQARKPNSVIDGVNLGAITYSYRSMPDQGAEATLRYAVDSGISQIELMSGPAESFAGSPAARRGPGGGDSGRGRGQPPTPEQQAARREAAERLKAWRTSVSSRSLRKTASRLIASRARAWGPMSARSGRRGWTV